MLFLSTWRCQTGKIGDTYKAFMDMAPGDAVADGGPKIKLLGRWHDMATGSGVAVWESDDPQAMALYSLNWNDALDIDVVPVVDDATARAISKAKWG